MKKKPARIVPLALLSGTAFAAFLPMTALGAPAPPPAPVVTFSRNLPVFFEKLGEMVASEKITQTLISETNATVARRRVLESDFEISHLAEDPTALWEFRFVRTVDGRPSGMEREVEDFFRLKQPSAAAERGRIVQLAIGKSLPGCYWHNLTVMLQAFGEENLPNFEWKTSGEGFAFEQVRGIGISENPFSAKAPHHYPSGRLELSADGKWPKRLDMTFVTGPRQAHVILAFSPPEGADTTALPLRYEARHENLRTRFVVDRAIFEYSNYRRFTVSTEDSLPR